MSQEDRGHDLPIADGSASVCTRLHCPQECSDRAGIFDIASGRAA